MQDDGHFLTVARYVERNALRAGLAERAELWPWSSLWRRLNCGKGAATGGAADSDGETKHCDLFLSPWPVRRRADYLQWVNEPQTAAEEEALRLSVIKGRPFGEDRLAIANDPATGLAIGVPPHRQAPQGQATIESRRRRPGQVEITE